VESSIERDNRQLKDMERRRISRSQETDEEADRRRKDDNQRRKISWDNKKKFMMAEAKNDNIEKYELSSLNTECRHCKALHFKVILLYLLYFNSSIFYFSKKIIYI
jgi:hypothetical protein